MVAKRRPSEDRLPPKITWKAWATGSAVAGLTTAASLGTYFHNYVWTRAEGHEMDKRIEQLETRTREDMRELREELRDLTKAVLSKRESAALEKTALERRREVARNPSRSHRLSSEARREAGAAFWLRSFGDEDDPLEPSQPGKHLAK